MFVGGFKSSDLCFIASKFSDANSHVSKFSSDDEAFKMILDDNQRRCDFFKYFEYDVKDKIGEVRLIIIFSKLSFLFRGVQLPFTNADLSKQQATETPVQAASRRLVKNQAYQAL